MQAPRQILGALLATLLIVGVPAHVAAESALWTLVASPLTATTGTLTTFSLVATNEDPAAALLSSSEIGCIELTVPSNFDVLGAAVLSATTGESWSASLSGNLVTVRTSSEDDRLGLLDSVRFTVTALPTSTGSLAWDAHAHSDQACGGASALLGVPPVVVVTEPAATPTPTPIPPTPTPTPTPTPPPVTGTPTPTPTPVPGADATAEPVGSGAPSASPSARPSPTPTSSPALAGSPSATGTPPAPGGSDATEPGRITIGGAGGPIGPAASPGETLTREAAGTRPAAISLGPLGILGTLEIWIVPGLLYGIPGILIVAFILLQAGGAAAWLPAIRRLGGGDG